MQATLNIITNPFHPTLDRVQKPIQRKVRVNTLVNKHKIDLSKPVICLFNGSALLRKEWGKTTVRDKDVVSFVYLPQGGGGGSNPLRLVLMIAVAAFAPYAAGILGSAMGVTGGIGMQLLTAGIGMLGNMLVNALVPPPSPPKAQQAASLAAPSPTYTLSAQGNQARIGQAIPVIYGKMRVFPDFAAQPYAEYESNEQYLYQMFCLGKGYVGVDPSDVRIEDTPLSSFGTEGVDYQMEVSHPGSTPTLYPGAVYNVGEVSGQELFNTAFVGPFAVNPATTVIDQVAFDIVLPRGLYYANDSGGLDSRTVTFGLYATPIDDIGNPAGDGIHLGNESISAKTSTAIRRTYKYAVTPGRYSVSAIRVGAKNENSRMGNDVVWASARGYSSAQVDYGDVTLLTMKIKASNNISSQSSRKVNCLVQRRLQVPVWNAETETYDWTEPQVTRSIAHALMDMCRAEYGAGVAETRYAVHELLALHELWEDRGDELNCVFDSSQTFWEALCQAARAGRARPYVQGGMIHFVRDSAQLLPTAMFTSRNIVKNTLKITYVMSSEDTADCIDVEYFDEEIWKQRTVRATLDGSVSKPAKVKAFGITNRAQAFREGMYMAASNRYRRKEISFETELEGHIPSLGDLIAVQSDIPEWGQWGETVSVELDGAQSKLVSTQPFTWADGANHYMLLRRPNGSATTAIQVARGDEDNELVFNEADLDFTVYSGFEKERTHISFGREGQVTQLARVLSTTPSDGRVTITAINEDARVHSADGTEVPPDLYTWGITTPRIRPILGGFNITQVGSGTTPSIALSWLASPGASRYIIEKSTDNENWETLGEVTTTSFSFLSNVGDIFIRIAAFGGVIGPWVTKAYTVGEIPPPANVASGNVSVNGRAFNVSWAAVEDCEGYQVEVLNGGFVKRSFVTLATNYAYTVEQAEGDGGPWRAVQFRIKAKKGGVLSETALVLNGNNAAPAAPTLIVSPGAQNISVTVSGSTDGDYAGTVIHASTTSGFTPSPANKVYEGSGTFFLHQATAKTYFKAAHYDTYGKDGLNYSDEYSATPQSVVGGSAPDNTPPTEVTDVVITSKLGTNTLRWANPDDATLARVEIWRSETNNKDDATLIAAELGSVFVDTGVAIGTTYYYWLRTVDFAGNEGPFEPATDTTTYSVVTGGIQNDDLDPNIQFVVEIQEGEVESAHLAAGAVTAEKTKIKRHMIY